MQYLEVVGQISPLTSLSATQDTRSISSFLLHHVLSDGKTGTKMSLTKKQNNNKKKHNKKPPKQTKKPTQNTGANVSSLLEGRRNFSG